MRRETQNILLVLLGGALLKIAWTGSYLRYVKPSLLPFLVAAGVVILALGMIAIVRDVRAGRAYAEPAEAEPAVPDSAAPDPAGYADHADQLDHADHAHHPDHADHAGRSPWLLLLPVLAIFLVSPPALGADTVSRSAETAAAPQRSIEFPPLPADPAPQLRMSDFVTRAVWDDAGTLHGRQVRLLGFIVHSSDGGTYLARLAIACCAADATPLKVRLQGRDGLADLPQDAWFEVRGQVVPGSARQDTRFTPTLTVAELRPMPAPSEPYEF